MLNVKNMNVESAKNPSSKTKQDLVPEELEDRDLSDFNSQLNRLIDPASSIQPESHGGTSSRQTHFYSV